MTCFMCKTELDATVERCPVCGQIVIQGDSAFSSPYSDSIGDTTESIVSEFFAQDGSRRILGHKKKAAVVGASIKGLFLGLGLSILCILSVLVMLLLGRIFIFGILGAILAFVGSFVNFFMASYVEYDGGAFYIRYLFKNSERTIPFSAITKVEHRFERETQTKGKKTETTVKRVWRIYVGGAAMNFSWFDDAAARELNALFRRMRSVNSLIQWKI